MSAIKVRDIAGPIESAIKKAADRTGVDFGFLLKTARRESSLNPNAKAKTSSAAGLFQFVEQTWLGQLKRHGSKHGYGLFAQMIERGKDGRLRVPDEDARKAVMDLRFDAACSSLMAGELASDHASYLKGRIGRQPSGGELYAAHFLGPKGAARLIEAQERNPEASAANLFPQAAAANKSIFYRQGRACSVEEVYANLMKTVGDGQAVEGKPKSQRVEPKPEPQGAAYAAFSLNERLDRMRQERSLVDSVLNGSGRSAFGSRFDSNTLALLAAARDEDS
jgi:hypothetical protein